MVPLCETMSVEGLVQLVACNLVPHGYWFYVTGRVPDGKDPSQVDAKLMAKYAAGLSRTARARRKQLGWANVRYLRHERFFVLLATKGRHPFFEEEGETVRDLRRVPLRIGGYSISCRPGGRRQNGEVDPRWHAHVEIQRQLYLQWEALLVEMATHRSAERLAMEFYRLPFEPYAPVRRQMLRLLGRVNKVRRRAGLSSLPHEVLPLRRRIVRPFEPISARAETAGGAAKVFSYSSG